MTTSLFRLDTDKQRVGMRCTRCRKITRFSFRTLSREATPSVCPRCGYDGYRLRWRHARQLLADMGIQLGGETTIVHYEATGDPDEDLLDLP